jgi:hypothetical protein
MYWMNKAVMPPLGVLLLLLALPISVLLVSAGPAGPGGSENVATTCTSKVWGKVDNVAVEGLVEGPSTTQTSLQVACVFEYIEGDIYLSPPALPESANGMVHLDRALDGLITELRKTGKFSGHPNETLLIIPPPGTVPAKRLLLIGLGDRARFNPDLMIGVGEVALREALRLGVSDFAFASDLKDAGVDSPTAVVAGNVVRGVFQAYRVEEFLQGKNASRHQPLDKVTLLSGPAFFAAAGEGIKGAISALSR